MDNTTKLAFFCDGKVKTFAVARIYCPITADLNSENWCLNFPVVCATSDLGLILVNHTVILTADCLLTSSSTQGFRSQNSVWIVNSRVFSGRGLVLRICVCWAGVNLGLCAMAKSSIRKQRNFLLCTWALVEFMEKTLMCKVKSTIIGFNLI